MFDIFSEDARAAIVDAQAEAQSRSDSHIGCEHLLVGVLRHTGAMVTPSLAAQAITPEVVRSAIDARFGKAPTIDTTDAALATVGIDGSQVRARLRSAFGPEALAPPPTPFDDAAKHALQTAVTEASTAGSERVGVRHELIGIVLAPDSEAAAILRDLGVDIERLVTELRASTEPAT